MMTTLYKLRSQRDKFLSVSVIMPVVMFSLFDQLEDRRPMTEDG
jgi:hypothetical protein